MCTTQRQTNNDIHANERKRQQERALARAHSKEWHSKVTVAAKKIADAEAAGLRAPMSYLHRRSAERLRDLCSVNGGVYVKLGQHLSQLDFVLPPEFIDVLRCMLDQVRPGGGGEAPWLLAFVVRPLTSHSCEREYRSYTPPETHQAFWCSCPGKGWGCIRRWPGKGRYKGPGWEQLTMDLLRFDRVVIREAKHRWWRRCWFALFFPVRWVDGSLSRVFFVSRIGVRRHACAHQITAYTDTYVFEVHG